MGTTFFNNLLIFSIKYKIIEKIKLDSIIYCDLNLKTSIIILN
jgi:hypothetical protein